MVRKILCSRLGLAWAALGLLVSNAVLSGVLVALTLRPPSVVLTPMVGEEKVVVPGEIPAAAVRRFVLHYVWNLDNYTPQTLQENSNYVLRFISHDFIRTAAETLGKRLRYVEQYGEASQLVTPHPDGVEVSNVGDGRHKAEFVAVRRIYVGDRLSHQEHVRYVIEVAPTLPSEGNPYGFIVTGQAVEPLDREEPDDKKSPEGGQR